MKAVFVLVAAAAMACLPAPAEAKEFEIVAVEVEATLNPDASMRVVEHITYAFDGSFSNGFRPIPEGDYQLVDFSVTENGEPLPFDGAPHNLHWRYSALNEQRTFDIAYTVVGAAKVGPDVAELYWKWVGTDHPGVDIVRVQLVTPESSGVRAWAHGPLNGRVEIDGSVVRFSVDDLPGGRFVEGRVAVPSRAFTVPPTGEPRLAGIIDEETLLAERANAERERQAEREKRLQDLEDATSDALPFIAIAGWAIFLAVWLRWGREYTPANPPGEYLRELPDDPPAIVDALLRYGQVRPIALSATIVDLAQRGYLTIEEQRTDRPLWFADAVDWKLTRTDKGDEGLARFEQTVLDKLFQADRTTTQNEFEKWCKSHRTEADRWWDRVRDQVKDEFKRRKYMEGGKGWAYSLNALAGVVVLAISVFVVARGHLVGLAGIASAIGQLAATPALRRRSRAGAQRTAEWRAVERFLRDFSDLEEAPSGHLILWERYLVYAVALGVTASLARAMAARIPEAEQDVAPWFTGHYGSRGFDSIGSLADFSGGFGPRIAAAAAPPSSSGSGGGGGFSGGGGGGGGGGGIGAS